MIGSLGTCFQAGSIIIGSLRTCSRPVLLRLEHGTRKMTKVGAVGVFGLCVLGLVGGAAYLAIDDPQANTRISQVRV